ESVKHARAGADEGAGRRLAQPPAHRPAQPPNDQAVDQADRHGGGQADAELVRSAAKLLAVGPRRLALAADECVDAHSNGGSVSPPAMVPSAGNTSLAA